MSADELKEHILEAQKYDIDNISKMLNSDLSNAERTFRNAIAAGEVNLKIHKGNQDKHIPGTKNYRQEIENGRSPSILTTNADMLVKKYAGTGKLVFKKGKWIQAEMFAHSGNIGVYINKQKGEQYYTDCGRIHYSNKGTHVVPDRRKNNMLDVWKYDGLNVIVRTKDGRVYEGICSAGTDYETNMDYLDFDMPNNTVHEIDADEIASIIEK